MDFICSPVLGHPSLRYLEQSFEFQTAVLRNGVDTHDGDDGDKDQVAEVGSTLGQ